jgi:hypothetical protein
MSMLRFTEEQLAAMTRRNKPRTVSRMSVEDVTLKPIEQAKPSKYKAVKVDMDGRTFDSKKERMRYVELKTMLNAGIISDLRFQARYVLSIKGQEICAYIADFVYRDLKGNEVVEDVKGYRGGQAYAIFRLKKKLMRALHGIQVMEI